MLVASKVELDKQIEKEEMDKASKETLSAPSGNDAVASLQVMANMFAEQMAALEERRKADMNMMQLQMQKQFEAMQQMMQPQVQMGNNPCPPAWAGNEQEQGMRMLKPASYSSTHVSHMMREQRIKDLARLQALDEAAALDRARKMERLQVLLEQDNSAVGWP